MNSIVIYIIEQSENLPRYPELSIIRKIPRMGRSVASILSRLTPNKYNETNSRKFIEVQKNIAGRSIKKTKAKTGYSKEIGKLAA